MTGLSMIFHFSQENPFQSSHLVLIADSERGSDKGAKRLIKGELLAGQCHVTGVGESSLVMKYWRTDLLDTIPLRRVSHYVR